MSTEIIDFKTPSKPFEFEVRGFVVLSFNLHGTTLIELAVSSSPFCAYIGSAAAQAIFKTENGESGNRGIRFPILKIAYAVQMRQATDISPCGADATSACGTN